MSGLAQNSTWEQVGNPADQQEQDEETFVPCARPV